jgi:hypothetical protein
MIERTRMAFVLAVLCSAMLSACGGGSGGGGGGGGGTSLSGNANLAALTVTGADLEQGFDPGSTSYTAVVGFLIDSIQVDASAQHSAATVEVDGAAVAAGGVAVLLAEGDTDIVVEVTAEDGTTRGYTLTVTRQSADAFAQDAYVKASNTEAGDVFGYSVALSGDTLAVGAYGEDSAATGNESDNNAPFSGAVYVFTRDGAGVWEQQAYVKASNTGERDQFGISVALDGDTLAVGASREDSAATGIDGDESNNDVTDAGAVYVFTRDGAGVWEQQAYVKASNTGAGDNFGHSVALSGDTLAVGAYLEDSTATGIDDNESDNTAPGSGAVYVFTRDGAGVWSQQAYVKASNTGASDEFGYSVALSGDTLAVGAHLEASAVTDDESNNDAPDSGAVYVFTRDGAGVWSQQAYVKATNTGENDRFGYSVALSGDTLAVGAVGEDSAAIGINGDESDNNEANSGAVYVFARDGAGVWSQQAYVKSSNAEAGDRFGRSVALSGDTLAVGAVLEESAAIGIDGDQTDNTAPDAGAVYLFTRDGAGVWEQQAYVKASNTDTGDSFGSSVALSGDTLAVGAYQEDSAATDVGGDESDNAASGSGAVYLFGGVPLRNPDLSSLAIEGVDLDQIFQPNQTDYTAGVGFLVASAHLDALADDPNAIVRVNGNRVGAAGIEVSLEVGDNVVEIEVTAEDGVSAVLYTLTITRQSVNAFAQNAYVKASNTGAGDRFGRSVALSEDTLAVGAFSEDSDATGINGDESDNDASASGAVYVFTRDGAGLWSQQAYIKASNTGAGDSFGRSVALDGDTLAVGAAGEGSAATGIDGDESDNNAPDAGAVYVFTRDGAGVWSQQAYVKASNAEADDRFGSSVALSGDTLAVGAIGEGSATDDESDNTAPDAGAVYVFTRDGAGLWSQQAYVKASNAEADDRFGSVALSGDMLAVGATGEDSAASTNESDNTASRSGAVYVFMRDGAGVWSQQAYVKASNAEERDQFGAPIALSGDTLAIGAVFEDSAAIGIGGDETDNNASRSGAVYVFTRDGAGDWSQQAYVKASNTDAGDQFGLSVALSGDMLAVGADIEGSAANGVNGDESNNDAPESGAAYVFTRDGAGLWSQQAYVKASNAEAFDFFGVSVALSRDTLAIGAFLEDSAATGVYGDEMSDSAPDSGAVYVFD